MSSRSTATIILAAGNSSRLNEPKQLLEYNGKSLLQIAIDAAEKANVSHRIVILGANECIIKPKIDFKSSYLTINLNWKEGMSNSLQVAIRQLLAVDPDLHQIIVMLCDQPYVSSQVLNSLIETQETSGKGILACYYQETFGVPVLFDRKYFDKILNLCGKDGAKNIIYEHPEDTHAVHFPKGRIDIDTKEDYENLKNDKSQ